MVQCQLILSIYMFLGNRSKHSQDIYIYICVRACARAHAHLWLTFPYYLKYRAQIFQYFAFVSIILFLWLIFICYSHSTCANIMKLFNFLGILVMEVQLINFLRLLKDYALQCEKVMTYVNFCTTHDTHILYLLSDFCVQETSTQIAAIAASPQNVPLQVK